MSVPLLTDEEFQRLLERAAERHTRQGGKDFSLDELVEAGRELGIDLATIRDVFEEHRATTQRALMRPPMREHPRGSALRVTRDADAFVLVIPPPKTTKVAATLVVATLSGLTGISLVGSLPASVVAGIATIGTLLSAFAIRRARTTHELRLAANGDGQLIRRVGKTTKVEKLDGRQLHARLDERTVRNQAGATRVRFVALDHGTETHELLSGYSPAEQAWVVDAVEHWLGRR